MTKAIDPELVGVVHWLYLSGLSTRKVSGKLGISSSVVSKIVKKLGISRSVGRPRYTKTKNGRTCRAWARRIWEEEHGPIPKNYVIHHIDNDPTNNSLGNLLMLSHSAHSSLHNRGPEYHVPKWQRTSYKEYMRKYRALHRSTEKV